MEHQRSTSNADDYRISQWNSSGPCFDLEIDVFYSCIDHGVRYNSLLEKRNYKKVILLNLKMFLFAWLLLFLLSQKIYNYSKFISKAQYFQNRTNLTKIT